MIQRFSARVQILLAFAIVTGFLVGLGLLVFLELQRISARTTDLLERTLPKLRILGEVAHEVEGTQAAVLRHLNATSRQAKRTQEQLIADRQRANTRRLQEFQKLFVTGEGQALFDEVLRTREEYVEARDHLLALSNANRKTEAESFLASHEQRAYELYTGAMDRLVRYLEEEVESSTRAARDSLETVRATNNLIIGVGLGIVVILGIFLTLLVKRMREDNLALQREVQERRQAQEALHLSERRYATTLSSIGDAVMATDRDGRITYMNGVAEQMTGWPLNEALHQQLSTVFVIVNEQTFQLAINPVQRVMNEGIVIGLANHTLLITRNGKHIPIADSAAPIVDDHGAVIGVVLVFHDYSERRKAEQQLKQSFSLLQATLESTTDGILVVDRQGKIQSFNRKFVEMWRIPAAIIESRDDDKALAFVLEQLKDPESFLRKVRALYDQPHAYSFDILEFNDSRMFERYSQPQLLGTTAVGRVWSFRDVTERQRSERALRESEENFRTLVTNSSDAIYVFQDNRFVMVNPAWERLFGYSAEEVLSEGFDVMQVVAPESRVLLHERRAARRAGKNLSTRYRMRGLTRDGRTIDLDVSVAEVLWKGRLAVQGIYRDVTESIKAERALRESEERYRAFFEQDLTADDISTPDGKLLECNPAYLRMFGFQSKEAAATWNTVRLYASPEKRERVLALLRERKVLENFELELRKKDGTPLWVIANLIGIFNDAGELTSIRSYLFDNTDHRRLEEGLRQSQKMESIGTLAGGIAHDFNNILGIILGYVSLIRRDRNQPERLDASIDAIGKAVERAAGLVNQILTFAHRTPVAIQAVQANDVLKDMARLARETFPKNITMHLELTEPLPAVAADTNQLHQVFLNLSVNARDAMPSGGTLTYRTMLVAGGTLRRKFNEAGRHPYVCVSLSDTGVGMDDTTRRRLFEPFYTTKRAGKGTGLGLAVVYGIIASHKGFVEVESAVNRGTTFHLYLPVAEEEQTQAEQVEQEAGAVLGGSETILLVEDEEMLMEVLSSSLRSKGYTVLAACDGDEALRVFEQHRGDIKLVITDFGLPLRTGFEVFQALRKKAPSLNVVLASGYIDPQQQTMMSAAGVRAFLQKPYQIAEVLKKIREILDERR